MSACATLEARRSNMGTAISVAKYAQQTPGCGITPHAQYLHPEPPLPRSINSRRMDVFQAYLARFRISQQRSPVQTYTVEVPELEIGLAPEDGSLSARAGESILSDVFRYNPGAPAERFGRPDAALELRGKVLVAAEGYADSYWHFMVHTLVRLAVVMQTHPRDVFDHIVLTDGSKPFARQAMEMLGVPAEKIVSLRHTPRVRCERAYCGQFLSELVYPHTLSMQLLRGLFPTAMYGGKKLYIVRTGVREITNHEEVRRVLEKRGFEVVRCETLSMAEQVKLFASADAIVGAHGAGLSNMVFSPRGTRVIECLAPRFVETIFWYMATSCGLDYSFLMGGGEDPPLALKNEPGGWRSSNPDNVEVDPEELERLCAAAGV